MNRCQRNRRAWNPASLARRQDPEEHVIRRPCKRVSRDSRVAPFLLCASKAEWREKANKKRTRVKVSGKNVLCTSAAQVRPRREYTFVSPPPVLLFNPWCLNLPGLPGRREFILSVAVRKRERERDGLERTSSSLRLSLKFPRRVASRLTVLK